LPEGRGVQIGPALERGKFAPDRLPVSLHLLCTGDGGIAKDLNQARRWFQLAAEQGDREAQAVLGGMYMEGEGGPAGPAIGARWLRRAAEAGHPEAMNINRAVLFPGLEGFAQYLKTRASLRHQGPVGHVQWQLQGEPMFEEFGF
jgi:TPR repeat protein